MKNTKMEIITIFILIMLTISVFLIYSGAMLKGDYMNTLNNILLLMIFGALLTTNMLLIKLKETIEHKHKH